MEQNNTYNILNQITQESKSLWRIQHHYVKEAGSDEERDLWHRVVAEKETLITQLKDLLKKSL